MILSRVGLPAVAATLAVLLAACQTAGTDAPSTKVQGTPVDLPATARQNIATRLVSEYVEDATGLATISKVRGGRGLFGASADVQIRYPVLGRPFFLPSDPRPTVDRCVEATALWKNGDPPGAYSLTIKRSRIDGSDCVGFGDSVSPYSELEQMAAKIRACRTKAEERCLLLSTTMPEAETRKLMTMR
jgi:hypothetical protein